MNIFSDYAARYYESGFSVIPLKTREKRPFFDDWSRFCLKAAEVKELESWERDYASCNIGLCLGEASGVAAFDFDWDGPHLEVIESWVLGHLPIMPVKKVGEKGWTAFFKYSGQSNRSLDLKINGKSKRVFDFLSSGKQTVLPPSIHPSGFAYRWLTPDNLLSFDVSDLPVVSEEELENLCTFITLNFPNIHEMADAGQVSIEPRHNQIFKQICKLSCRLKTIEEIVIAIMDFDRVRFELQAPGWQGKGCTYFNDPKYFKGNSVGTAGATKLVNRVVKWLEKGQIKLGATFILGEKPKDGLKEEDTSTYELYKAMFEKLYPNSYKDKLTGEFLSFSDGQKIYLLNEEKVVKAKALIHGMKKTDVSEYFDLWLRSLPVKLNLELPTWDGKDYIKEVFSFISVNNVSHDVFIDLVKEWFAGIFHRVSDNHWQNRLLLLEGAQGVGKDTFITNIFSGLGDYFCNIEITQNEKDAYEKMERSIVINISEFDRSAKISSAQIKNMITSPSTLYRKPYARAAVDAKFRCSFISSCNLDDVLRDETGNRRFLMFKIDAIDWNYPKGISAQILSQALALYKSGYKASPESVVNISSELEKFTPDKTEDIVLDLYNERMTGLSVSYGKSEFLFSQILPVLRGISEDTKMISVKGILSLLKKKGLSKHTVDGRIYSFMRDVSVLKDAENIQRNILKFPKKD